MLLVVKRFLHDKNVKTVFKKTNRPLNGQRSIGFLLIIYISVFRKLDNNGQSYDTNHTFDWFA